MRIHAWYYWYYSISFINNFSSMCFLYYYLRTVHICSCSALFLFIYIYKLNNLVYVNFYFEWYRFPLKSFSFMYMVFNLGIVSRGNSITACAVSNLLYVILPFFTLLLLLRRLNSGGKSWDCYKVQFSLCTGKSIYWVPIFVTMLNVKYVHFVEIKINIFYHLRLRWRIK